MSEKYYTPAIEEFHVGFEYEELSGVDSEMEDWSCKSFDPKEYIDRYGEYTFDDTSLEGWIRVKYLDKDDIESFGFKTDNMDPMIYCKYKNEDLYFDYNTTSHELKISTLDSDGIVLIIKNKSELKVLLKQLNII